MDEKIFDRMLEDQLCFEVYRAANGFSKMYGRALSPYKLTFPQYLVLLALWDENFVNAKSIQQRLGISIGTLNPILTKLEAQNWINKETSQSDKRASVMSLTKKANDKKQDISHNILKEVVQCNLDGINEKELLQYLKNLNQEFTKLDEKNKKIKNNSQAE
ncbi:MarR family transcriptional regulator [Jeotgalibaca sp. MA1X17-3]|uniref:MarR family winged helix-turn-helix transcriptional regulator n=1 Tax=Jeotgalibaca sp. MA1X17-3 TaxID=2908211 RepID=UPI001F2F6F27|nr:MarR family transcriptional regulator [Jeotgalibaca sp. MA1X17-3]UJF16085.1 MarR family transcriptional regulator [Jeotgalibaca sp. MA1X17-3]